MKLTGDRNQCPGCEKYFNSSHAFDKHRAGQHKDSGRYCLSSFRMVLDGMVLGADGFWRGSEMPKHLHSELPA